MGSAFGSKIAVSAHNTQSRPAEINVFPDALHTRSLKEALIKSPLRKSDPVSTIEIHLPLKSKSFLRHPSNLKFGQDFQLRLNQRFPNMLGACHNTHRSVVKSTPPHGPPVRCKASKASSDPSLSEPKINASQNVGILRVMCRAA